MIFVSILSLIFEKLDGFTLPISDTGPETVWDVSEIVITLFFTFEYALLMYIIRNPLDYIVKPNSIFDFLAILPFYIDSLLKLFGQSDAKWILIIRLLRIARLGRIRQQTNPYVVIIGRTFLKLRKVLSGMIGYLCIGSISIGTFAHVVEEETFHNVPTGMWYGLVTLTTVGYGDVYPSSTAGHLIGSVSVIFGLCLCSIVLMSVGQIYNDEIEMLKDQYDEIKQCLLEHNLLVVEHGDDLELAPDTSVDDMVACCIDSDYCYPEIMALVNEVIHQRKIEQGASGSSDVNEYEKDRDERPYTEINMDSVEE